MGELTEATPSAASIANYKDQLWADARESIRFSKSENTTNAYTSDWTAFVSWCDALGFEPLPAQVETVVLYLSHMRKQGYKVSTIQRRLTSIRLAHKAADFEPPTSSEKVRAVWKGIRVRRGIAVTQKKPILIDHLRRIVDEIGDDVTGLRDKALLLVGFAGAFRRSELVSLNVTDIEVSRDGLTILLRRSKTDQEGEGRKIGIPYGSRPDTCPVRALQDWLSVAQIREGPLFRHVNKAWRVGVQRLSDKAVARIVKKYMSAIGYEAQDFSGHSLRAGLATSAAIGGAPEAVIMAQTGHKSVNMVRRYIRDGNVFRDNAASYVGL